METTIVYWGYIGINSMDSDCFSFLAAVFFKEPTCLDYCLNPKP